MGGPTGGPIGEADTGPREGLTGVPTADIGNNSGLIQTILQQFYIIFLNTKLFKLFCTTFYDFTLQIPIID